MGTKLFFFSNINYSDIFLYIYIHMFFSSIFGFVFIQGKEKKYVMYIKNIFFELVVVFFYTIQ